MWSRILVLKISIPNRYLYITHCLRWAELQLMLDEVVFAFLGLYHSNPIEVPKIISMSTVLAFNI